MSNEDELSRRFDEAFGPMIEEREKAVKAAFMRGFMSRPADPDPLAPPQKPATCKEAIDQLNQALARCKP